MNGSHPSVSAAAMPSSVENLIIILDRHAVPFCHYENPGFGAGAPQWMPFERLRKAVRFVQENGLSPIYLLGRHAPPAEYLRVIGQRRHTAIVPAALRRCMKEAIPVLEAADVPAMAKAGGKRGEVAVLRLNREAMPGLARLFQRLAGKFKRLNVCLTDIGDYQVETIEVYRSQLDTMTRQIIESDAPGWGTECNILTDRLMLREMNNCAAGIRHLTLAPNGRFYLCPGFYYRDARDAVGTLHDGVQIKNAHLLTVERAPICRRCDAYHCRRCLLLNKTLTDEINTPSRQQCLAAHAEREASRFLLEALKKAGRLIDSEQTADIPTIDYEDPFELVRRARGGKKSQGEDAATPIEGAPESPQGDGLMARIVEIQERLSELIAIQQQIVKEIDQLKKERHT